MNYTFTIFGKLPSLNEFLAAERRTMRGRGGYSPGNQLKRRCEFLIRNAVNTQVRRVRIKKPIRIHYHFYEENRKRDLDNISAVAHKYVQDALVKAGVIENDGWRQIIGFTDHFEVDRNRPRIEVTLEEVEK